MSPAETAALPSNQRLDVGNTSANQKKPTPHLSPKVSEVAARVNSVTENRFLKGIETQPLLLSNHNVTANALQESAYELLQKAQTSILLISFTLSDPKVLEILNQKAQENVEVKLVIDREHIPSASQLHPSIKVSTRITGEGHLHHKALVIDHSYVWLGSANFTTGAFSKIKNLAIGCLSKTVAEALHQEATHIESQTVRTGKNPISYKYGNQLLELYILPHNDPCAPEASATTWNDQGKRRLLSLIDEAQQNIKIAVDNWTMKDASHALIAAHQRGVNVEVVTNYLEGEAVQLLLRNGIKIKPGNQLHHKFMLVDNKHLLNGSPNWTVNMVSRSDESFFVLYDLTSEQQAVIHEVLTSAGLSLPIMKTAELPAPVTIDIAQTNKEEKTSDDNLISKLNGCMLQAKVVSEVALPVIADSTANEIKTKEEWVNRTIRAIHQEIKTMPSGQEEQRMVAIASRLASKLQQFIPKLNVLPVPGCCHYDGKDYLRNVVAIAEKQERIENALMQLKITPSHNPKVSEYFQTALVKLKKGNNVPLPDFYHATRAGLESIIKSQNILQSTQGAVGPGTYISCNNEGDSGYGPQAFAIDESCLVGTKATTFTGRKPNGNVFYSVWAAVLKDIPVTEETIAFIDTTVSETPENDIARVKSLLQEQNLNIPVIDRQTSDEILRIFDLSTQRREFPSFGWSKSQYLPKNMYPRSQTGTFRKFAPTM